MQISNNKKTIAFGLLIILAGFGLLLHSTGALPPTVDDILISWQMLLIIIGIYNLFSEQSKIIGYVLIAVGSFFLLPEIFSLPNDFKRNFWPVILILLGILILFRHQLFKKQSDLPAMESGGPGYIDEFNVFSGSEKRINSRSFRGGRITSIFGGSDIDFSEAELADEVNVIEVLYIFGGSTVRIPDHWQVENRVTAILGGFSDKRKFMKNEVTTGKTLIIRGLVIFGGGEIKS